MFDGLIIDETEERRATERVIKEFEETLKKSEEFENYLRTLQSLIGEGAIIKFRTKGGELEKRDEWIIRRT